MVWVLLGLNIVVFLAALSLSPTEKSLFFHLHGVVPARFIHPEWAFWRGYPDGGLLSFVSYMFLHGDWMHLVLNMWTLWIFGDNVEDVMGPVRFALFYTVCGLCALLAHVVTSPDSTVPVVGASGAIAGVMGAYFFLYPQARVLTLILIVVIPFFVEIPAVFYLVLWFLTQVLSGLSSDGAGVAWWAHIGGFVAGMLLLRFFRNDAAE